MAIWATPMRLTATVRATPGMSMSLSGRPAQLGATGRSIIATRALGSTQSSASEAWGTSLRSTRSIVHWTVAIVVMPRRS